MVQANAERARIMIGELVRCGINQFVVAPGFRSAPLALAAISHPSAHVTVHFDERGSAFFALGYGRAARDPCVWITTSGTAAANGFPAVIEASMDSVPMICLTADRPAELRDTGANQTIDQVHLFGHYPRWFADLPTPGVEEDGAFLRSTMDHAVYKAREGPVHLNCMFREPLLERDDQDQSIPELSWPPEAPPQTCYSHQIRKSGSLRWHLIQSIQNATRGLIVAGRLQTVREAEAVSKLSKFLGWPLLADICAPVAGGGNQINFFDLIVRNSVFAHECSPDVILHLGGPLVSKELQKFLAHSSFETYAVIAPSSGRIDPFHAVTERIQGDISPVCDEIINAVSVIKSEPEWMYSWVWADGAVRRTLELKLGDQLSEPSVAWDLSDLLDTENWILGASSMPVRDLQSFFCRKKAGGPRIFSNRGASGIDGTLATAAGISRALPGRGTVLLGDLALLHDLNSLHLLREKEVTIVVTNNDGGGIFHMLPIALGQKEFEQVLGTPHGMDFQMAAEQFYIPYSQVNSRDEFKKAWRSAARSDSPHLIEVQTDRKENAQIHNTLYALASEITEQTLTTL